MTASNFYEGVGHSWPLRWLCETASARVRLVPFGGICPRPLVVAAVPVTAENTLTGYRPDPTQLE